MFWDESFWELGFWADGFWEGMNTQAEHTIAPTERLITDTVENRNYWDE